MAVRAKQKQSSSKNASASDVGSASAARDANGATTSSMSTGELAPMIRLAEKSFRRELPKLLRLRSRLRQWVAYQGSRRLGFAATKHELYKRYLRQGMMRGELYVRHIAPATQDLEILFDI